MRKILLSDRIDKAFNYTNSLVELKSALLGICTDIERYFKVKFNINLNEPMDEESFVNILFVYRPFRALSLEQMNRFVLLFINIRNVCAHLYLSKPIILDDDLKSFILSLADYPYPIEENKVITIYGAVLILMLMAQKYMVWPFCVTFFKGYCFKNIGYGDEASQFQINQQSLFNSICGIGKPVRQNYNSISNLDFVYMNDLLKKCLTSIFFDLEKSLQKRKVTAKRAHSLSSVLRNSSIFDEQLISKIVTLRNCWFHGFFLGDVVEDENADFIFDLDFVADILKELSKVANLNRNILGTVCDDINYLALKIFDYYVLRLVEVSYKILDNRLLTEDKLESRLSNTDKAFARLIEVDPTIFETFANLIDSYTITWSVAPSKFLDRIPRSFSCKKLIIAKIHSDYGFTIGDFKTERTDIVLIANDIYGKDKNLVNGFDLSKCNYSIERNLSEFITIVNIKL